MEAGDLVQVRHYGNEEQVARAASRDLSRARPEARIQVAVQLYRSEDLSLARAASLAGACRGGPGHWSRVIRCLGNRADQE